MPTEGVMMYCIRLPDGKWWRRGAGLRPGGPVRHLSHATQYGNKGAAKRAAEILSLEEAHGGYEVVECPRVVGNVALRVECPEQ